jgi:hypothetical protein
MTTAPSSADVFTDQTDPNTVTPDERAELARMTRDWLTGGHDHDVSVMVHGVVRLIGALRDAESRWDREHESKRAAVKMQHHIIHERDTVVTAERIRIAAMIKHEARRMEANNEPGWGRLTLIADDLRACST